MKIRFVITLGILLFSVVVFAQKKKQKNQPAEQTPPVQTEVKKDTVKQTQERAVTASEILSQHYANKYAVAVQWNDYEVAKDALYDLITENPGNDSLIFDLAYYYYQNGKFASSALITQELLKRNPKNTTALEIAANSYENLGALDRALQSYESLYLLGNNLASLYKMAILQFKLKRYQESITSTDILLSNKDTDSLKVAYSDASGNSKEYAMKVAVFNLKGMVAKDQGDKVAAKKFFEQSLALAPDFVVAKQNLLELNKK